MKKAAVLFSTFSFVLFTSGTSCKQKENDDPEAGRMNQLGFPRSLVGGTDPGKQDGVNLPSDITDEAYIDNERSYAANETAINWNAPFAYLVNALEALQVECGLSNQH